MLNSPDLNINEEEETNKKEKKNWLKTFFKLSFYSFIFLGMAFVFFFSKAIISKEGDTDSWFDRIPILGQIKHLAESADRQLKGEERDRVNILLLGMGGKKHEGGYLTDTIMLASFQPSSGKVALLSIPRDLSVPIEGRGWGKINSINAYAEFEEEGQGSIAISQALSDLLEIPIDYYLRIDFEGFINIVDEVGGVKVYVDNTLKDYRYPIMGRENAEPYESRFEFLHIEKGWQEMDGSLALKYARSRYAGGIEGSDFARAKRQQKVIEATKEKLNGKKLFFQPKTILEILNQFNEHLSTNLKVWEIIKLYNLNKDISSDKIINKVLDNTPNGLLIDTRGINGAYLLTPRSGDFDEIKYLVQNIFSDVLPEKKDKVVLEKTLIEVKNGTWINGLASRTAIDLEKYGFDVIRVGNSSQQNFQKTVIYDLTYGSKMESLLVLKEKTKANVSFELPNWLLEEISQQVATEKNPKQPDFILILGQDADISSSGMPNLQ